MIDEEVEIKNSIPHLLTYPRSGSHYFEDILYKEAQITFTKSHYIVNVFDGNNKKQRPIITIARDPNDSIISYLALASLQYTTHDAVIYEKITEYILMYAFLSEHADYVIDFNDMINYPELVIKKILTSLKINQDNYFLFSRNIPKDKHPNFIPSSKSLSNYKKNILDGFNTDLCYFYYNKLLEKKIMV